MDNCGFSCGLFVGFPVDCPAVAWFFRVHEVPILVSFSKNPHMFSTGIVNYFSAANFLKP
ncbi:hypothetical protein HMPREF0580_0328 [Mobiluncus mulieris ATCC 35239]|uniref:Uncharacterized protein n=1 Tax=Mobiluncus mulieris ATCC 35239 TaxID=871571 RepID=E0QN64_9ACTO|nr:hypothetical protein HMPREF0580_0328 [Mobiluncus mulieris ATCC 35239]